MSIPEDKIMHHLNSLIGTSDPGDTMHHMHVVSARPGPLGIPNLEDLHAAIYGLAPDNSARNIQQWIAGIIATAAIEATINGRTVLFAGLSHEVWSAPADDLAEQLRRAGTSMSKHPDAVEMTIVYAAARDGRRWTGRRWLTGPKAGQTEDATLLVGPISRDEGLGLPSRFIRKLVDLPIGT